MHTRTVVTLVLGICIMAYTIYGTIILVDTADAALPNHNCAAIWKYNASGMIVEIGSVISVMSMYCFKKYWHTGSSTAAYPSGEDCTALTLPLPLNLTVGIAQCFILVWGR
jgi:hypothetical protein